MHTRHRCKPLAGCSSSGTPCRLRSRRVWRRTTTPQQAAVHNQEEPQSLPSNRIENRPYRTRFQQKGPVGQLSFHFPSSIVTSARGSLKTIYLTAIPHPVHDPALPCCLLRLCNSLGWCINHSVISYSLSESRRRARHCAGGGVMLRLRRPLAV